MDPAHIFISNTCKVCNHPILEGTEAAVIAVGKVVLHPHFHDTEFLAIRLETETVTIHKACGTPSGDM